MVIHIWTTSRKQSTSIIPVHIIPSLTYLNTWYTSLETLYIKADFTKMGSDNWKRKNLRSSHFCFQQAVYCQYLWLEINYYNCLKQLLLIHFKNPLLKAFFILGIFIFSTKSNFKNLKSNKCIFLIWKIIHYPTFPINTCLSQHSEETWSSFFIYCTT